MGFQVTFLGGESLEGFVAKMAGVLAFARVGCEVLAKVEALLEAAVAVGADKFLRCVGFVFKVLWCLVFGVVGLLGLFVRVVF